MICNINYKILEIKHNQYQEAYIFIIENETIRVDIGYNSKQKITYVKKHSLSNKSIELENLLLQLQNIGIVITPPTLSENISFSQNFLEEFHQRLEQRCQQQQIQIDGVVQQQWCQRYKFRKDQQLAVFDIWYNGKSQFTKFQPCITACSPGTLVSEIEILLREGLSS